MRALARSDASERAVAELGAEPARGDLGDADSIAAGAEGCELAFHLAAHLGDYGDWEDFERGNVEGTRNALDGCARAGVRRFVHCGTEAALMAGEPLVNVDETAPLRPDSPAPYPATKARAEQAVRDANRDGFETVVLRPRFVWGAGDTTLLPEMVKMVEAGRFVWVGGGGQLTATTQVENVVEGLMLAADKGTPGEAYFVTDGEPVVFREFVSATAGDPGRGAARAHDAELARPHGGGGQRAGLALAAPSGAPAPRPLHLLGADPGVHDRRLEGAP